MNIERTRWLLVLTVASGLSASASAQTVSPFQPPLKPLGLPVVGKTCLSGTDAKSQSFESCKASFLQTIASKLPEGKPFTGAGLNRLDPTRLYFTSSYAPRVYYLHEGACYDNALGVTIANVSEPTSKPVSGTNYTVFPCVHSSDSEVCASGSGVRSAKEPLLAGDFVQLPTVNAGQQLAFFIMSEMDHEGQPTNVFHNGESNNDDDFQHLIAYFPDDSEYLVIGFEDMDDGGDEDCNDLMFAVDIGPNNAAALRSTSNLPR